MPATAVLSLLHTPPEVLLLSVVALPIHSTVVPVMIAGSAFTVTCLVVAHPVPNE